MDKFINGVLGLIIGWGLKGLEEEQNFLSPETEAGIITVGVAVLALGILYVLRTGSERFKD